ncbi:cation diffusion facilitator family transporter [Natronospora cellulosivora (SeqCode)]
MLTEKERYNSSKKVSFISLLINIFLAFIKILVGFTFASKALIADGLHSASDIASTLVILISIKFSHSPADKKHPYGHGKAEAIGTTILGLLLFFTGLAIIRDTAISLYSGEISVPGRAAIWIALISILAKEGLYRYTVRIGKKIKSKGLIADAHHHRSDAFSSIAALIGVTGARLGVPILDPLAALIVAIFIAKIGVKVIIEAVNELMDGVVDESKIDDYKKIVRAVHGVKDVGDIKLRLYGHKILVDLTLAVDQNLTVAKGHQVAAKVSTELKEQDASIKDVLIHVDPWESKEL